jgi:hypothetical protein
VDRVALSCAVVSTVLGEGERIDFGHDKPRDESNCSPWGGIWGDELGRAVEVVE